MLARPLHQRRRDRPVRDRCRDAGQWRSSPGLQHARHGLLVRRIPGISVARPDALPRRHHQRRDGRRHRRRFEPALARRDIAARALPEARRHGRDPLSANRQPARLDRQQEFGQIEMHRIDIPAEIMARAMRARGRDHIFERIEAARTAHVVVDLQNGFMAEGAPVEVPTAREIVPNVNRICAALREAGGTNVFLRYTYDPAESRPWTTRYSEYLSPERSAAHKTTFPRGAEPWQ